jgi:hypothetical protein
MADIAMCANASCPSNMSCHRFTAVPNEFRQNMQVFSVEGDADNCGDFMSNEGRVKNPAIQEVTH